MKERMPNKGAGNTAAEEASKIPQSFLSLHHVGADDKDKKTFKWTDVFDAAALGGIEGEHTAYKEARARYENGQESISQQFLSFAREAGDVEQFNTILKSMRVVWKATNNKAVPQAIHDAASVVRRAWSYSIDPTKATSIGVLKGQLKEARKKEKELNEIIEQPTAFSKALVQLGELHRLCASHIDLQEQLTSTLNKVGTDFAEVLDKAIGKVKPTKKIASPTAKAA